MPKTARPMRLFQTADVTRRVLRTSHITKMIMKTRALFTLNDKEEGYLLLTISFVTSGVILTETSFQLDLFGASIAQRGSA